MLSHRHLLDLESLSAAEIQEILDTAEAFRGVMDRPIRKVPVLRGHTIVNLFFEPSTRTRISFELAEKRLSADIVNFAVSTSSVVKGETLKDTAENILAMRVDTIVIRHGQSGAARYLAERVKATVINAGDGTHEHPTQGLLDIMTMRQKLSTVAGKRVVIVGDLTHSRVARSNIWGLNKLGAQVTVCGPPPMIPAGIESMGVTVEYDLRRAVRDADCINVLRIQNERIEEQIIPSHREYVRRFRVDEALLAHTKPTCFVMHPGPINRDVEISSQVADGKRQVILEQVVNGVAVRMAVLYLLSGGAAEAVTDSLE